MILRHERHQRGIPGQRNRDQAFLVPIDQPADPAAGCGVDHLGDIPTTRRRPQQEGIGLLQRQGSAHVIVDDNVDLDREPVVGPTRLMVSERCAADEESGVTWRRRIVVPALGDGKTLVPSHPEPPSSGCDTNGGYVNHWSAVSRLKGVVSDRPGRDTRGANTAALAGSRPVPQRCSSLRRQGKGRGSVASTFAWLDHSEEHRRRMMEVVGLFRETGTVDELGVGSVRDTLSDILFPGTSTLHTRARYLLFVPWICRGMERDRVATRHAPQRLKQDEVRLIDALDRGGERETVIGIEARANLKQFPSSVYWSALGRYGIRVLPASRGQYLRSLDGYYARLREVQSNDDGEPVGGGAPRTWHAGLPDAAGGFLEETTFALAAHEADYLTERILDRCRGTYLAHLLVDAQPEVEAEFPWMHPAATTATPQVREQVDHARIFSEVIFGAALLYNLMLAEKVREARTVGGQFDVDEDLVGQYRARLDDWVGLMAQRHAAHRSWDRARFWQVVTGKNPRVPRLTVKFVNDWTRRAIAAADTLRDDRDARRLIASREAQVKRARARLHNLRALERWTGTSGAGRLDFRWSNAARLVGDIRAGRDRQEEVSGART